MSILSNTIASEEHISEFAYNEIVTTSLKIDPSAERILKKTTTAGSRRKAVFSFWVKLNTTDVSQTFWSKGEGGGVQNSFEIGIQTSKLMVSAFNGDSQVINVQTTRLLRDPSAWYHIVVAVDTTQATAANKVLIYINGELQTDFSASTYGGDQDLILGDASNHTTERIGTLGTAYYSGATSGTADGRMKGYIAEFNHVDGLSFFSNTSGAANSAFNINSFGELNTGVWIPVDPVVSDYGDNGFRLRFNQTGVGTASTSTIGADTSTKNNHFTSVGIVASDCAMPDSPENNFCTGNPSGRTYTNNVGNNPTYREGNLGFVTAGNPTHGYGTMAVNHFLTAGCYFEVRADRLDTSRAYVGIVDPPSSVNEASYGSVNKALTEPAGRLYITTATDGSGPIPSTPSTFGNNDIIGIAVKGTSFWFHVNGTYSRDASNNVGNPSTGANPAQPAITDIANQHYLPHAGYHSDWTFNFGQDPTFGRQITAGTETPSSGAGVFKYAVPTGFVAMCSANMEELTIGPDTSKQANDYFETVTYEGDTDGTDGAQNIAVNFKPDWTWIKNKDATDAHQLFDSNRLATKVIEANDTTIEVANADTLTAFISSGFSLGDDVTVNTNDESYVSWNWKANGGTATSTITESGDNPAASVQANPTAGFSLITYTGTGDSGTIAHGLSAVPTMMIIKNRDVADAWAVFHRENTTAPATDFLILNTSAATADSDTMWADAAPTDSVFTVHDSHQVNADGEKYVAYVFADIEGYSKMGSYTANNSADGPFVYLGFRPAWVMFKDTTNTSAWIIKDSVRGTVNPNLPHLAVHTSAAEGSTADCDFLSNGFKIRQADAGISFANKAGANMIYMAFAEAPFKFARAK